MSNMVIDCYSVSPPLSVAVNLLANLGDWWTFDNTLASEGPNHNSFQNSYGGSVSYESGLKAQQLICSQEMQSACNIADDTDWSFAGWIDMSDNSGTQEVYLGVGQDTGLSDAYHCAFFMPANGLTAGFYIRQVGTAGFEQGSYQAISLATRLHLAVTWEEATLTARAYVNGVLFASETLAASPPAGCIDSIFIRNAGGPAFDEIFRHLDELSCYPGYRLSLAEVGYLYNSGAGKSYAELVADAS